MAREEALRAGPRLGGAAERDEGADGDDVALLIQRTSGCRVGRAQRLLGRRREEGAGRAYVL
jgi:hypothetical protein